MGIEEAENEFRKFMSRLLSVEVYEGVQEERSYFSFDMLKKTLGEFCDIIAEHIGCDSCTINLQLYDYNQVDKETINQWIFEYFLSQDINDKQLSEWMKAHLIQQGMDERSVNEWVDAYLAKMDALKVRGGSKGQWGDISTKKKPSIDLETQRRLDYRLQSLYNHMVFPYWRFGKGLSLLAATNRGGPWTPIALKKQEILKYIALDSGVTKDVYQENTARIRDRLTMRATRNLRKLGRADIIVWNNLCWRNMFKSYYGVPIRIHSRGEVLGLLKVENKKPEEQSDISELLEERDFEEFHKALRKRIQRHWDHAKNDAIRNVSFLAFAYLLADLRPSMSDHSTTAAACLLLPYPQGIAEAARCFKLNLKRLTREILEAAPNKQLPTNTRDALGVLDPEEAGFEDFGIWSTTLVQLLWQDAELRKVLNNKRQVLCDYCDIFLYSISARTELLSKDRRKPPSVKDSEGLRNMPEVDLDEIGNKVEILLKTIRSRYNKVLDKDYASLLLDDANKKAPIQLFFTRHEDEQNLWLKLCPEYDTKEDIGQLLDATKQFYDEASTILCRHIEYVQFKEGGAVELGKNWKDLPDKLNSKWPDIFPKNTEILPWFKQYPRPPHFHFRISTSLGDTDDKTVFLQACVTPSLDELQSQKGKMDDPTNGIYAEQSPVLGRKDESKLRDIIRRRRKYLDDLRKNGGWEHFCSHEEHCLYGNGYTKSKPLRIIDLLHDRLAARIHALVTACPIQDFTPEDTHKLSWAAFEIGKLVERQIAYRANKLDDPMPLTTLEFSEIPISDMSFVDNLRARRNSLRELGDNIGVYLKDVLSQTRMTRDVEYVSRMKDYSSYFQRTRERYEAYMRGNIAVWVYLLSQYPADELGSMKTISESLKRFKESVNNLYPKDNSNQIKLPYEKMKTMYGDLKFGSPPFLNFSTHENHSEKQHNEDGLDVLLHMALKRLSRTLTEEGLLEESLDDFAGSAHANDSGQPSNQQFSALVGEYIRKHAPELENLLFRNYSCFSQDAFSLFCQLSNRILEGELFRAFYDHCHQLRTRLCTVRSEMRGDIEGRLLLRVFGLDGSSDSLQTAWQKIWNFVMTYRTSEVFAETPGQKTEAIDYLRLTPIGIYKRIRTLRTVLKRQRPPAILDWELGRFDLYGARLNCLFKNQMFVLYENIWNKGDPFFSCAPSETDLDRFAPDPKTDTCESSKYRKRWLCLRTNSQSGGYTSLHIAALVDPDFASDGYWEEDAKRYNLRKVQHVLGNIFKEFETAIAEEYRNFSWHRHLIGKQYTRWYDNYIHLIKGEQHDDPNVKWFGSFLFEGIFDLAMILIYTLIDAERFRDNHLVGRNRFGLHNDTVKIVQDSLLGRRNPKISKEFISLLLGLYYVCHYGREYSEEVAHAMCKGKRLTKQCFKCDGRDIVSEEESLVGAGEDIYRTTFRERDLKHLRENHQAITPQHLGAHKFTTCQGGSEDPVGNETTWQRCLNAKGGCHLYGSAMSLMDRLMEEVHNARGVNNFKAGEDVQILKQVKDNLESELKFFLSVRAGEIEYDTPLFFLDAKHHTSRDFQAFTDLKFIVLKLFAMGNSLSRDATTEELWFLLYRSLRHIRREQRSYLLADGVTATGDAGLWRRDKDEILGRIKNYTLLFSPEEHIGKKDTNGHLFMGWRALDLYYYMRSLIPIEIQIRTKLIDTLAEQYHDPVYKQTPPSGTELPCANMIDVGKDIDKADRELEIDYEDYALRFQLEQESSENEDDF